MKKQMLFFLINISLLAQAQEQEPCYKTVKLRNEISVNQGNLITEYSHPFFYSMIQELSIRTGVTVPKYIYLYSAEYYIISKPVCIINKNFNRLDTYVDDFGDLYICREVLSTLPYDEIEATIALALAAKFFYKSIKEKAVLFGFLGMLSAGTKYGSSAYSNRWHLAGSNFNFLYLGVIPMAILAARIYSNSMQKLVDFKAIETVDSANIISALRSLSKLSHNYYKPGVIGRIFEVTSLNTVLNTIFYPALFYSLEERIAYIQEKTKQDLRSYS